MLKIWQTELFQRITEAMLDIAAEGAGLLEPMEGNRGLHPAGLFIQARAPSIYGGSNEIQRSIMRRTCWTCRADREEQVMDQMPILTRRRIEAAFAKEVYEEMKAELGEEPARRILSNAVIKMAKSAAAEFAREAPEGRTSLDSFRAIQSLWTAEDALRIELVKSTETEFHFDVTRCRYAEMYRSMGLADLGGVLSCNRGRCVLRGLRSPG